MHKAIRQKRQGTPATPAVLADGEKPDAELSETRQNRFQSSAQAALTDNRFIEFKRRREEERKSSNVDALAPRKLGDAVRLVGTCLDMCPAYEREEREYQNNVDKLEMYPGTKRIDPAKAVKAYHRPAAGNEQPPPEDIRPPLVLQQTLDYLFDDILGSDPDLTTTHPFLRDRTRSVRQDFTVQSESGPIAIECNERIARFHIYCLHAMRGRETFSESQELEQLRKVLQTLNEFYDDARREAIACPNEGEFRAYYLITHLRDADILRQTEILPSHIFDHSLLQTALQLQALAQNNNDARKIRGRSAANSECSLNGFSRFFKMVASSKVPFLLACLLETHFMDVRRGGLKAMRKAYLDRYQGFPLDTLATMLGCDDAAHCADVCSAFSIIVAGNSPETASEVILNKNGTFIENVDPSYQSIKSIRLVENKRGTASLQSIISGQEQPNQISPAVPITPRLSAPPRFSSPTRSLAPPARTSLSAKVPTFTSTFQQSTPQQVAIVPSPFAFGSFPAANAAPKFDFSPLPSRSATASPAPLEILSPKIKEISPLPIKKKHSLQPVVETSATLPSPGLKSSLSKSRGPSQKKQPSPTRISPPRKQIDEKALVDCLYKQLLSSVVEPATEAASIRAISSIEHDEQERESDVCSEAISNLASQLLAQTVQESARSMIFSVYQDRQIKQQYLGVWKATLKARQERHAFHREQIRLLREQNGPKRHTKEFEDGQVDLGKLSIHAEAEDSEMANLLSETKESVNSLWGKDTFGSEIRDRIESLLEADQEEDVKWTVLSFVPDTESTISIWHRCKLGFSQMQSNVETELLSSVEIEKRLIDRSALYTADLSTVGMLLFDTSLDEGQTFDKLRACLVYLGQKVQRSPAFSASLVLLSWGSDISMVEELQDSVDGLFESVHCVEVNDQVDDKFSRVVSSSITAVRKNAGKVVPVQGSVFLLPLVNVWRDGMDRFTVQCDMQQPRARSQFVKLFLQLNKAVETIAKLLNLRRFEALPAFRDTEKTMHESLRNYTSLAEISDHFADLRADLAAPDVNIQTQILPRLYALCCEWSVSRMRGSVEVSETLHGNLQNSVAQFESTMSDMVNEAIKAVKQKRRASETAVAISGTPPKKQRSSKKSKDNPLQESQWLPSKLSALQALLATTGMVQ